MDAKKLASHVVAAAALAFITAPMTSSLALAADTEQVKCFGVNACKGKSACKTAQSSCKGQNSCKGKGFLMAESAEKCKELGGSTEEPAS